MPSTETHRCCVCAIETENRCAACSAVGTDLFFCSKEHQKLVWKVHKRFCGKGGFDLPLLEPEEAELAKKIAFTHRTDAGATLGSVLLDGKQRNAETERWVREAIDAVTTSRKEDTYDAESDRLLVSTVRASLLSVPGLADRPRHYAVGCVSLVEFALHSDTTRPWYPALMHQVSILVALSVVEPCPQLTLADQLSEREPTLIHRFCMDYAAYLVLLSIIKDQISALDGKAEGARVYDGVNRALVLQFPPNKLGTVARRRGMEDCLSLTEFEA
ncbi:hypothetical protein JCM10207_000215 [Rhodosporidiobolus poonsookiae]